jgi:4-amino-4-deoxy-L-arabinose transferase-like glycosyltransferase
MTPKMSPRRALLVLIVSSALVRLITAVSLGPGNDEAYHFLYAANPALSYYDHPPMTAWVEKAGLSVPGAATTKLGLRIGFIALFAGSTWMLARLTARYYGGWSGFLAAFALNISGYYGLAASTLALPDGPLLFFWLWTIECLCVALEGPPGSRLRPWVWVGLAWGGAMLSKYHASFLPLGAALFVLLHRPMWRWVLKPGPYLALLLGLGLFSPVLVWNVGHHWASFLFQGGRAVGSLALRPDLLAVALLAQVAYLFPWIWLPLVIILLRGIRGWSQNDNRLVPERLLLCLAVVPSSLFTAVACFRPVLPHWGLIGLASLFPILGNRWWGLFAINPVRTRRLLAAGAVWTVGVLAVALFEYHTGRFQRGEHDRLGVLDIRTDPTVDLYGWDQVADRMKELGLLDDPQTFVFTRYWYQSAQIAYALGGMRPVLCYNADDPRGFAFWSRPEDWVGRDGVLVTVNEPDNLDTRTHGEAPYYARWFHQVEHVCDFWVERGGKPVRRIGLYRCVNQRLAYPFGLDRADRIAQRPMNPDNGRSATTR